VLWLTFLGLLLFSVCSLVFFTFCCVLFDGFMLEKTKILDGDEECTIGAIVPEGGRDVVPKSYCGNFSLASGFISLHLFSL
jgi:hypothetical protein